jgi:hypothetical protein
VVEPIARLRLRFPGNFIAEQWDPGVGGFNVAEVGSVKGLEGFLASARGS